MTADEKVTQLAAVVEQIVTVVQTQTEHQKKVSDILADLRARVASLEKQNESLERQCAALHQRTVGLLVAQ
jgi:hypothetical protein